MDGCFWLDNDRERSANPFHAITGASEGMRVRHKYNAKIVERDGFKFKSKKQGNRYDELKLLQKAGEVIMFLFEVPFRMPGTVYWADSVVWWADGSCTVEDVKGFRTDTYKMKKRMMAVHYPCVDIQEL